MPQERCAQSTASPPAKLPAIGSSQILHPLRFDTPIRRRNTRPAYPLVEDAHRPTGTLRLLLLQEEARLPRAVRLVHRSEAESAQSVRRCNTPAALNRNRSAREMQSQRVRQAVNSRDAD